MQAKEKLSFFVHLSNSSLMGVLGTMASLDLWMGTFTGREVAKRKSVTRFLLIITGLMLPNSSLEEDKEDPEELLLQDIG